MPPLFPVDPSLADTLTDTGTLLNYGGALGTGVIQRNNLLTKYFPGAPLKLGGAPVVGAVVDYGANKASGDSTGRAIRETAVNTVATGIGTAGGGAACGAVTAGTAGVGAAACPFLVIGGTALGAGGGWVANKVIDGIAGVF